MIFQPLFRVMPSVGIAKEICSSTNSKLISIYSLACNVFFTIYMDRKRRDVKKSISWCVVVQNVSTYRAVGIKVPCDYKVHSAGLYSFFDINLTTVVVKYLLILL